ncbi:MAG TPA: hypothetical protein VNL35_16835 [Chloroflexota bacterium]|nr:hypothetical protein [Chloroflexota bacterium]
MPRPDQDRSGWRRLLSRLWPQRRRTTESDEQIGARTLLRRLTAVSAREHLDYLAIDGIFARSFFLLAPPDLTDPGWLDRLVGLDCPCRIAIHLEGLDRQGERNRLKRRRRSFHAINSEQAMVSGLLDVDAESAQAETAHIARETQDPRQAIVRWSLYVTVFAQSKEELDEHAARAYTALASDIACEPGQALPHQLPIWQSTLPFCLDTAHRTCRAMSATIGNAFPFLTHNPGMTDGLALGFTAVGHELVLLNPFDRSLPNALMNDVGASGSGKTYLAQKLGLQMRLRGGRVTILDHSPGHYRSLTRLVGGCEVSLGAPEPPTINLWDYDGTLTRMKLAFVADAHAILLADEPGENLGALERAALERGIRSLYARHRQITEETGSLSIPLEREMIAWLEEEARLARDAQDEAEYLRLHQMAVKLAPYVGEGEDAGRHAALVDRHTSIDTANRFLVFDLEGMDEGLQAFVMFLITESVQRRVYRAAGAHDPAEQELLIIDEGYLNLITGGDHAKRWLSHLARRGRHWGLFLLFITQQLSDLLDDPTAASLFNNASVQLLFRQDDQKNNDGRSAVDRLGAVLALSPEEVRRLAGLGTVEGVSTEMLLLRKSKQSGTTKRGVVEIIAHPLEHALFGSNADEVTYRERMIEALDGNVWAAIKACAAGLEVPEHLEEDETLDLAPESPVAHLPRFPGPGVQLKLPLDEAAEAMNGPVPARAPAGARRDESFSVDADPLVVR